MGRCPELLQVALWETLQALSCCRHMLVPTFTTWSNTSDQAAFPLGFGGGTLYWEGAERLPVSWTSQGMPTPGYSHASSFHLLYLFDFAGFHSSSPLLALLWMCFLYWLTYILAEVARGERRCLKPGKSERIYREERYQS